MRIKKVVVGLAALAAVGALAACSAANASTAANHPKVVAASGPAKSIVDTTTSSAPTTTTTTTVPTTTAAPSTPKKATPPPAAKAPVAQAPAQAAAPAGDPCGPSVNACVDLATRKAWLVENGQLVLGPVSIMPGRPGFRTPVGTFHVLSKVAHYWSHAFNAPMPDAVFFYPGVAFHIGSLSVLSHGCVHLSPGSAATFFNTLHIGDEVQVLQG